MKRIFINDIREWDGKGVLSILGPTGSGKTSAALDFADKNGAHPMDTLLVSIDAVAVYRELDIGSAKPRGSEREKYNWLGLDLRTADQRISAMDFADAVEAGILAHLKKKLPVILAGGSHFYEKAIVEGRGPGGPTSAEFVESLASSSSAALHARLLELDARWDKIHSNDRYRLQRFLDLTERQGLSYDEIFAAPSAGEGKWETTTTWIRGLDIEIEDHRRILALRMAKMLTDGWIEEVNELLKKFTDDSPGLQTLGYREAVQFLRGSLTKTAMEEAILRSHLHLAKKQKTWLRGMLRKT